MGDPLGAARGITRGLLVGAALWAVALMFTCEYMR